MRTADGGAAVREPRPGGAGPPRGMAWQEGLRMAPEVRRRRWRRAALQQGQATRDLLARAPATTAGGAGPPAGAAPVGRRRYVPRSSSGAGPRWRRGAGAEGRGGSGTALRATQQRQGGAGPAHRGGGGAGRPARWWGASERDQRERELVSQRVVKWAGVRRVSDLGHNKYFSFFLFSHSCLPCATVLGTRQTCKFRRVPEPGHTAKTPPRCMLWRDQAATLAHARCGG